MQGEITFQDSERKLIVVSNRLPFVLKRNGDGQLHRVHSAGGLVTALGPVVMQCGGLWVGWPGSHDLHPLDEIPEPESVGAGLPSQQVKPVFVRSELFDSYYNGCCNGTLWPLFHSMPDRAVFSSETWKTYEQVNEEFALKTLDALRQVHRRSEQQNNVDGMTIKVDSGIPVIWIHDYQLMLAAAMIRQVATEENLACKLGFFLHIPFPSWDIMRLLPWDDQILEGILACDMVGFHIEDYCTNFMDCCQRRLGCRVDRDKSDVEFDNRIVHVRPLPIGIPFAQFAEMALKAPKLMKDERVVLGVDRLDYTKGLVQRMKAFERLLELHPEHLEKVVFMQIAVPSRTDVKEYRALKEEIDQLIGRINGRFSTPEWSPIRYIYGCISQENLAAFYRDSAVALVTPLRDGMNLVAKEYVACQIHPTPGVLILSPFAGAGGTMTEALLVNPYEVDLVAETIHKALCMEPEERRTRMKKLRERESTGDVDNWMESFLKEMDQVTLPSPPSSPTSLNGRSISPESESGKQSPALGAEDDYQSYLADYIAGSSKLNLLLDYDGTLTPIVAHPDLAVLSAETRRVLTTLAEMPDVSVCIMSGRSVDNLKRMVNIEGLTYAGAQGLEILHPDGSRFIHPVPSDHSYKLQSLLPDLQKEVCTQGAWVENKGAILTYHYRAVPADDERDELVRRASQLFLDHGCLPHHTQMAIEARPPIPWGKGRASLYILRTTYGADWPERVRIVYAGDDDTDEDVMKTLGGLACTFRISKTPVIGSAAKYRLDDPDSVLSMLCWTEHQMMSRVRSTVIHNPHPLNLNFAASFLITCTHVQSDFEDSEEDCTDQLTNTSNKRRRRNSRGPAQQLQDKAAAALTRHPNFKAALCSNEAQSSIAVIGH